MGWGIATMPFAREPFLTHTGSNTMNLAMIMLQPSRDFGMVLATNVGGDNADRALRAVAEDMYGRFGDPVMWAAAPKCRAGALIKAGQRPTLRGGLFRNPSGCRFSRAGFDQPAAANAIRGPNKRLDGTREAAGLKLCHCLTSKRISGHASAGRFRDLS